MGRRRDLKDGQALTAIRTNSFRLFGRYGHDGVSMLDVARACDITKAALYWHFSGKEALYLDALGQLVALFEEHVFEPADRVEDPVRRLLGYFGGTASLARDPRVRDGVAGFWLDPAGTTTPAVRTAFDEFHRRACERVAAAIEQAEERKQLSMTASSDEMARAIFAVIEAIVLPLNRSPADQVARTVELLSATFLRAYASDQDLVAALLDAAPSGTAAGA